MNSSSQLSASINQTKKKNEIHNRNRQRRRLYGTWLGEGATHDSKTNLIRRIDQTLEAIGCWPATRKKKKVGIRLARGKGRPWDLDGHGCRTVCPFSRDVAWWRGQLVSAPKVCSHVSTWRAGVEATSLPGDDVYKQTGAVPSRLPKTSFFFFIVLILFKTLGL